MLANKTLLAMCILSALAITGCDKEETTVNPVPDNSTKEETIVSPVSDNSTKEDQIETGKPDAEKIEEPIEKPIEEPNITATSTETLQPVQADAEFALYVKQGLINTQKQRQIVNDYDLAFPVAYSEVGNDSGLSPSENSTAVSATEPKSAETPTNDVSSTNVQVAGVDELDLLKNDHETLFFVEKGTYNNVIQIRSMSQNPAETAALASIKIDDKAEINGLYLFDHSLVAIGSAYQNYQYYDKPVKMEDEQAVVAELSTADIAIDVLPYPYYQNQANIMLWGYDVSDTANPGKNWQIKIDGRLLGSRKIDNTLYIVSQYDVPQYAYPTSDVQKQQYIDAIAALPIEELLPSIKIDEQSAAMLVNAQDCFLPDTHKVDDAFETTITTITSINLSDISQRSSSCYAGNVNGIYATKNAVYLTANVNHYYQWWWNAPMIDIMPVDLISTGAVAQPDAELVIAQEPKPEPIPKSEFSTETLLTRSYENTLVHKFSLNETKPAYRGSAAVPGGLYSRDANVSYRMGENGDYLNIITSSNSWMDNTHRLTVLTESEVEGKLALVEAAHLPNSAHPHAIGKPNEDIYSVRFDGDRAYIVTFQRTDPLYVLDLSDNVAPVIAGELEIPGYSGYLHPVNKDLLLGIGKEAINNGGPTLFQGLKIALFDVSDISNPKEMTSLAIGKRGTDTAVLSDFHALTYLKGSDVDKFTLPITLHGGETFAPVNSWEYYPWLHTGLYTFELSKGDSPKLVNTGVMVVNDNSNSDNGFWWSNYTAYDRAVIQGDALHYLHDNQVHSALWDEIVGEYSESENLMAKFKANYQLWQDKQPEHLSYSYSIRMACECEFQETITMNVINGEFASAFYTSGIKMVVSDEELLRLPKTIEALFNELESIIVEGKSSIKVTYNSEYGYPESYVVDEELMELDGAYVMTVANFQTVNFLNETACGSGGINIFHITAKELDAAQILGFKPVSSLPAEAYIPSCQ